ncbi:MAG TPA: beta-ketoacyl synthase N-terminal-like domain-containing protein, partial [Myxococcota bacterium]|nr:beta-ketoacyl synthase N-terminal-like domain-containing protein [Myxococcota bacterium]
MSRRVVVTGLGVIAPNGNGLAEFEQALRKGKSGIRRHAAMEASGFACRVAGAPQGVDELAAATFEPDELLAMNSSQRFCSLAAVDAWRDAGLPLPERGDDRVDWETGAILGTGIGGMDTVADRIVPFVNEKRVRRLGSTAVEQCMSSGVSARVSGLLALGNQVTTNSSACSTGVEAVALGLERIRRGQATRMVCGGSEGESHYIWAG